MSKAINGLEVPPFVQETGGTEVLRAFVDGQNGLSISLKSAFEDPSTWGLLLVDVARHVARAYAKQEEFSEDEALDRIRAMFDAEWDRPTDLGRTDTVNN
jgi:Domain of unknown function (DUF5076)